ncbi:MAG TPA: hypothetical protein VIG33_14775 [Pseudobdellovibrionaceae bacterium]|jgi:hypothetical protein
MELAAFIIAVIALIVSLASLTWLIAKQLSTHQVQLVPVDPFAQFDPGKVGAKTSPMGDDFKELGEPLSPEEKEYFDKLKAKK